MDSKQYNFYFNNEKLDQIDSYLHENGLVILASPSREKEFSIIQSITERSEDISLIKYITSKTFLDSLHIKHIPTKDYYLMDIIKSNVVEFIQPFYDEKLQKEKEGRIYFTQSYYDDSDNLVQKPTEFLEIANTILKNVKLLR